MSATKSIPAICYDLATVSSYFRSVATVYAFQTLTRVHWVEYRDSSVLNAIYSVLAWKGAPGTVEITQNMTEIEKKADELHEKFLLAWIRILHEKGPLEANKYVSTMLVLRQHAREFLDQTFRDANDINREIIGETSEGIKKIAAIKLTASVGVSVIGAAGALGFGAAGAAMFAGVSLANNVTCSIASTWDQGGTAKAVGIQFGKAIADKGLGDAAKKAAESAIRDQKKAAQVIKSAEGQIRKYSSLIGQQGIRKARLRKASHIVRGATKQVATQREVLKTAGQAGKVARVGVVSVPLVFAAIDIFSAISEYNETVDGL